jgi:hypothetical protein
LSFLEGEVVHQYKELLTLVCWVSHSLAVDSGVMLDQVCGIESGKIQGTNVSREQGASVALVSSWKLLVELFAHSGGVYQGVE